MAWNEILDQSKKYFDQSVKPEMQSAIRKASVFLRKVKDGTDIYIDKVASTIQNTFSISDLLQKGDENGLVCRNEAASTSKDGHDDNLATQPEYSALPEGGTLHNDLDLSNIETDL